LLPVIYRALWVVPVTSPVIADGAVLVHDGRIQDIGPWQDIKNKYSDVPVRESVDVLMPGLVNAHMHLELSVFGVTEPEKKESTMCDWIRALLKKRMAAVYTDAEILAAAELAALDQYESGVVLLLDTGNSQLADFSPSTKTPEIVSLLEMLGPSKKAAQMAMKTLDAMPADCAVTGHAPYSTTPELLQYIKKSSSTRNTIFSLHVAENPDEALLLMHGMGCFVDFLKERDAFDGTFPITKSESVIEYLHDSNLLDTNTICVHCVHVDTNEIDILAESGSYVCLCPQSNKFLNVGEAPLYKFLDYSILPCLGTDSIASNPVPDMWQEMALLSQRNPSVDAATILRMATLGGARAMQRESDYGSLQNGRSANFLMIQDKNLNYVQSEQELLSALILMGRPGSIERASE